MISALTANIEMHQALNKNENVNKVLCIIENLIKKEAEKGGCEIIYSIEDLIVADRISKELDSYGYHVDVYSGPQIKNTKKFDPNHPEPINNLVDIKDTALLVIDWADEYIRH